jgi:hypothetical protein
VTVSTEREKRAQAYREFQQWARQLIADTIIRHGFSGIDGVLVQILNAYSQLMEKNK